MAEPIKLFVMIPWTVLNNARLSFISKLLFGVLKYFQYKNGVSWPSTATLATFLGCSQNSVRRAVLQLKATKLIEVERRPRQTNTYAIRQIRDKEFLRLPINLVSRIDKSPIEKLLYAYLFFRQGQNLVSWPHQETIAADLGCTRHTIRKALAKLAEKKVVRVGSAHDSTKSAHGGLKQGNRYCISTDLFFAPKLPTRSESRGKKWVPKDNTLGIERIKITRKSSFGGLSKAIGQDEAYRLLLRFGIYEKVAHSVVFDQLHPPASVKNAVKNALARRAWLKLRDPFRAEHFKIPGYIVASLNAARREVHTVKLSNRSVSVERLNRPGRPYQPLPPAELDRRRRQQIQELLAG